MSTEQAIAVMAEVKSKMLSMYGVESIGKWHDGHAEWFIDDKMLLIGLLSDVQEMNERGMVEEARQALNRAKWLITEHL